MYLLDYCVITINGYFPSLNIKQVLLVVLVTIDYRRAVSISFIALEFLKNPSFFFLFLNCATLATLSICSLLWTETQNYPQILLVDVYMIVQLIFPQNKISCLSYLHDYSKLLHLICIDSK